MSCYSFFRPRLAFRLRVRGQPHISRPVSVCLAITHTFKHTQYYCSHCIAPNRISSSTVVRILQSSKTVCNNNIGVQRKKKKTQSYCKSSVFYIYRIKKYILCISRAHDNIIVYNMWSVVVSLFSPIRSCE
jgi:hypothetical protein